MQKITPWLWFDTEAENAANDYVRIFSNRPGARSGASKVKEISRYGEAGPREAGLVMTVTFDIEGQEFAGLNGGPDFQFNESVSFMVNCKDQEEVDYFWDALLADGGKESVCGWLKDRYGVSWQIIPEVLGRLMGDPDAEKARRVTEAMLKMVKIDVAELQRAYDAA
jgi:predicted 3-demethylubiquinone-9 3-methyltransferase (glyoxalase superfamily)